MNVKKDTSKRLFARGGKGYVRKKFRRIAQGEESAELKRNRQHR